MASPVLLDGSHGEGGGALVRTALVLAALTEQPIRIEGVRAGTRYPGLDAEDLTLLNVLAEMTRAETKGPDGAPPALGDLETTFVPTRSPRRSRPLIETVRASGGLGRGRGASAPILLCALAPVLAATKSYVSVAATGETFGTAALGADGFALGTLPLFRELGLYAEATLRRGGWGRESDGRLELEVEPSALNGLAWTDRGEFVGLRAQLSYAHLPRAIAERGLGHLERLAQNSKMRMEGRIEEVSADTPGISVTVAARYRRGIGFENKVGTRGLRVESVAQSAFDSVFDWMASDATLDPYLAEHALLPLALASGSSEVKVSRLTQRFLTGVWVIKQMLPARIVVRGSQDAPGVVTFAR